MSETVDTRAVVVERALAHTPEKVWRALTEGELLARWIMPNDFKPVVGRKFAFRTTPSPHWNGVVHCQVREIEPLQRLVIAWGDGTAEGGGVTTTVVFTLTADGQGARLRMEQSGFTPQMENNRRGAEFGWNRMMDALGPLLGEI